MPASLDEPSRVGRAGRVARRGIVLAGLLLSACGGQPPAPVAHDFQPLDFSYLTPLRLNVASIEVDDRFVPAGAPPDVSMYDPISPTAALEKMARERLQALGSTGKAVFVVDDAALTRVGDTVTGTMRVELDIVEGNGTPAAYAQATVTRAFSGDLSDMPAVLYGLTRTMMDQMNVEFEFQVRRSLRKWLLPAGVSAMPVQTAPLPPPGETSETPPAMTPSAMTPPAMTPPPAPTPPAPRPQEPGVLMPPLPPLPGAG
jgi:hypothetical protein